MVMTVEDDDLEDHVADELRAWARGRLPLEAAVELLATSCGGRLLTGPWTRRDGHGGHRFDVEAAAVEKGYLSGGERRVLEVAMSLTSSEHPADLSDVICGLDGGGLDSVLTAIAHAGGRELP